MNDQEAEDLLARYLAGTLSDEELSIVNDWYLNLAAGEELPDTNPDLERVKVEIWKKVQKKPVRTLWPRIAAAASILIMLSAGGYFILHKKQPTQQIAQNQIHDIKPGGNKAILTLAGGQQIMLTGARNGILAQQGNTAINKTANGQIVYKAVLTPATPLKRAEIAMNTITTPPGGKWFVALSDGTKVWLNAASSITYPITFTGNAREVIVTGEAYFEVIHNAAKPFKVVANGQTIEDIGTSFDINAYNDEPQIRTTLVDGSIRISNSYGSAFIKPGQQAQATSNSAITVIADNDMEKTLAWKNGLFIFNHTDLYSLMRQLSRWYDVEVVYQEGVKNDVFFGKIKQDNNLSEILKVLELGDVHFRIEGKKLIVQP